MKGVAKLIRMGDKAAPLRQQMETLGYRVDSDVLSDLQTDVEAIGRLRRRGLLTTRDVESLRDRIRRAVVRNIVAIVSPDARAARPWPSTKRGPCPVCSREITNRTSWHYHADGRKRRTPIICTGKLQPFVGGRTKLPPPEGDA